MPPSSAGVPSPPPAGSPPAGSAGVPSPPPPPASGCTGPVCNSSNTEGVLLVNEEPKGPPASNPASFAAPKASAFSMSYDMGSLMFVLAVVSSVFKFNFFLSSGVKLARRAACLSASISANKASIMPSVGAAAPSPNISSEKKSAESVPVNNRS